MKDLLLIGGEGYIGRAISAYFLNLDYKITSIDNHIHGSENYPKQIDHSNYKFVRADMNNLYLIKDFIHESTNIVLLGGLVGDPITKKYPNLSHEINDLAVKNIIDLCMQLKQKRFIFVSTCSNYGLIPEDVTADENYKLDPLSLYAKAKVNAEKYIMSYKNKTAITPTILRFANAFGLSDRMRFDLTINQFVRSLQQNQELMVFDENTWRPYCHVTDFARAISSVISAKKELINFEIFNCGSDNNNYTKKMIIDEIFNFIKRGSISYKENDSDPRNYRVNFSKIKKQLKFEAKYSVEHGIKEIFTALENKNFNFESDCKYGNYIINK